MNKYPQQLQNADGPARWQAVRSCRAWVSSSRGNDDITYGLSVTDYARHPGIQSARIVLLDIGLMEMRDGCDCSGNLSEMWYLVEDTGRMGRSGGKLQKVWRGG